MALREEIGDKKGISLSLINIGNIYKQKGDYAIAMNHFVRGLKINEEIGDKVGIGSTLNNIGIIHKKQGNLSSAINYYKRSLVNFEEIEDKQGQAKVLNNIGNVYRNLKEYSKAIDYYTRGLTISEDLGSKPIMAAYFHNIGAVYHVQNNYESAKVYYLKSLVINEEISRKKHITANLSNIGDIYKIQGDYSNAISFFNRSLTIANDIEFAEEIRRSSFALYEIYSTLSKYKKSLEMHELYMVTKNIITSNQNQREVIRLEYEYEYAKKKLADSITYIQQQKMDEVKHQLALEKETNRRYTLYIGMGSLVLLGIVGYRGYRRKQKINKLLEKQNKEKTAIIKEIHHRVKNNLQVVNSLLNLQSRELEDEHAISVFKEAQNRVLSMALLHEKMYRSDDLKYIDVQDHITLLVEDLVKSYAVGKSIKLDIVIEKIDLGIQTLVPLGLIINEIVTNAFKHAFKNTNKGKITTHIKLLENETYEMIIGDDGVGIKDEKQSTGIGTKLIQIFTKQLRGTLERLDQPGTLYKLIFEKIDVN